MTTAVVVGAGWIGRAIAESLGVTALSRRTFRPASLPPGRSVVVASGRSIIPRGEGLATPLAAELAHLRIVMDAAERAGAPRIIVLGSSDVAGMAPVIDGRTDQQPRTNYALIKAALEDECVARHSRGIPVTCVRLAPVHGRGKQRTSSLVSLSRLPIIPVPSGGHHSTGFVLLADAVRAIEWLLEHPAPAVQSVGAGPTSMRLLLQILAQAQGRRTRCVSIPFPATLVGSLCGQRGPDHLQWLLRLSCSRSVEMDPPLSPTPLPAAVRSLVSGRSNPVLHGVAARG